MDLAPLHFIDEPIEVTFDTPPGLQKSPPCPNAIVWRGVEFRVVEMLASWQDYRRRGRFAQNMQPEHAAAAARRGSWGVGRFHFTVRAAPQGGMEARIFQIYYDRAPASAGDRKGHWFIFGEHRIGEHHIGEHTDNEHLDSEHRHAEADDGVQRS